MNVESREAVDDGSGLFKRRARASGPGLATMGRPVDQAAGLEYFDAPVLIGSTVSVATFWPSSASSLAWALNVSKFLRLCEVHSSIASAGVFTPNSSWANSSVEVVFALRNTISLAVYSLAPRLAVVNTASMVPLWVSAASLNLA